MQQINTDLIAEFLEITAQKKALKEEQDVLEKRISQLKGHILNQLSLAKVDSLKVRGKTVYTYRIIRAKVAPHLRTQAAELLRDNGLGHLVKDDFNLNELSGALREIVNNKGTIPEPLTNVIEIIEDIDLRIR